MNDLEKFLQQAAERLAQKLNEGQKPKPFVPPAAQRQPPPPIRSLERQPPPSAEIIEADLVEQDRFSSPRQMGPNPLSNIDTRPGLAQQISQTDERMEGHLQHVFGHEVSQLHAASKTLNPSAVRGAIENNTDLQRRIMDVSPLVKMLRQPDTLRAAFLASELFKRKF